MAVNPIDPLDPTSLAPSHFSATAILNNIFKLILHMTTSLQSCAAAQANRLTLLTSWQKEYTNVLAQIKTFLPTGDLNDSFIATTHSADGVARNDLNRLNSAFVQLLQNRQSVIGDDAKALQSNINQSNDAVNSQSNLGTAIIQELGTLLSAIYH